MSRVVNAIRHRPAVTAVGIVLLAMIVSVGLIVAKSGDAQRRDDRRAATVRQLILQQQAYLLDCTTPGPHQPTAEDPTTGHRCYDDGAKRTGEAIASVARSNYCAVLHAEHRTADATACREVFARLEALAAGADPFAAPTTTTVPRGSP